jgi:hypothetical protein
MPGHPEGALGFVSRFGFLRGTWGQSEAVDEIIHEIRVAQSLIEAADRNDWDALSKWMEANRSAIKLSPSLEFESGKEKPTLFFHPARLIDAIYLQFFEEVSGGANIRKCQSPRCSEWFRYGPGTKHRETAQYCSDRCRRAHFYLKAKEADQ